MTMDEVEPHDEVNPSEPLQRIDATFVSKLNLADFQNAVPLLREVSIVNETEEGISNLELEITSLPAFLKPKV